ncbi:hypothetical protein RG836_19945, partial [Pseudomonas sp. SZMC_28357]|nr:hypothetical protein [Pseudomonas sp. SZMC_28357]
APIAEDEIQGAIDPDLPFTWVRIPFDEAFVHEMAIELKWSGTQAPPGGGSYEPELDLYIPTTDEIDAKADLLISVDGRHLKILEGGTLALSYNLLLLDNEGEIVRRGSRPAALLNVGEATVELDKPQVAGEDNGVLDPDELPDGMSRLTVPRAAEPTRPGDLVTYSWVGSKTGRTRDSIKISSHNADQEVDFSLNARFVAEHIEPNRDGEVTVWYEIARVGPPARVSYSEALVLSIGPVQIDDEDFTDTPNQLITEGQRITSVATMDIEFLSGAGEAGIFVYGSNAPGMMEGPCICLCKDQALLDPPQRLRLAFKFGYRKVRFSWTWLHKLGKVEFYDVRNAKLGEASFSGVDLGGQINQWIELNAPASARIFSLVIEAQDYSFLDNFEMIR